MDGRSLSDGLHQALEAKRRLRNHRRKPNTSVHYNSKFLPYVSSIIWYDRYSKNGRKEFNRVYNMEVIPIPTNRPIIREDKRTSYT